MINRINTIVILIVIFLVSSCSSVGTYNKPFINTAETLKISEGMTRQEILMNVGQPYYVKSGKDNSEVVWVYEVRTILVKSELSNAQPKPNKFHPDQKHAGPHHKLQITFKNDKVTSWGPLEQEKSSKKEEPEKKVGENEEESNKEGKSSTKKIMNLFSKFNFTLKPIGSIMHEEFSAPSAGFMIGYKSFGLDVTSGDFEDGFASSIMLVYNKKINNLRLQAGLGTTMAEWFQTETVIDEYYVDQGYWAYEWECAYWGYYGDCYWYDYDYYWVDTSYWETNEYETSSWKYRDSMALRLALGYEFGLGKFSITPTYEMNISLDQEKAGFSNLTVNVGLR